MDFMTELTRRRLLFDGGMGALLASMGVKTDCPEELGAERPELIQGIHKAYKEAGANVIITNSLGMHPVKLGKTGRGQHAEEWMRQAVVNAKAAGADFVALDMGTTGEFLQPVGTLTFDKAYEGFYRIAKAGKEAGADFALLETMTDIAECRCACLAALDAGLKVAASFTFEKNGRTLTGGTPECAALTLQAAGAKAMGVNCSGGAQAMFAPLSAMRKVMGLPVIIQPNAGLPVTDGDGNPRYPDTAETMLPHMQTLLDMGASAIGGCCGTTPDHIRAFSTLDLSAPPESAWDGEAYICSARAYMKASEALDAATRTGDVDDLYDLEDGECARIPLDEVDDIPAFLLEAQMATYQPLIFESDDPEKLAQALRLYPGAAGVVTSLTSPLPYGAVKLV